MIQSPKSPNLLNISNLSNNSEDWFTLTPELNARSVFKEVKKSAIDKLEDVTRRRLSAPENEEETLKENDLVEITNKIHMNISKRITPEKTSRKSLTTINETVDEQLVIINKAQRLKLEEHMETSIQIELSKKAAENEEYQRKITSYVLEGEQKRIQCWKAKEYQELEEINEYDATEKRRSSLVLQLHTKKYQEQEKRIDKIIAEAEEMDKMRREESQQKQQLSNKIEISHKAFKTVFTQITDMLKNFPYREEMVACLSSKVSTVRDLNLMMDQLYKQLMVGEISQLDVSTAESLVDKLQAGYISIKNQLDEIQRQKESELQQKEREEQQKVQQQETVKIKQEVIVKEEPDNLIPIVKEEVTSPTNVGSIEEILSYVSIENLKNMTRVLEVLQNQTEQLQQLTQDVKLKTYRFQLQKAVNTPVNAISAVNATHLKDKLKRLQSLLRGQVVEISGTNVSAVSHPLGVAYSSHILAERIVLQGDQVVSSKAESAYPIAAVTLALISEFPLFYDLLLAQFYKQCPFLVPYYPPRTADMSDEDYYKQQGYTYNSEGQIEAQDKYLKRMTGIATLFFAIHTAKLPRDMSNVEPPLTLSCIWNWITSLLNLEPRPDITATLLLNCLEVCGSPLTSTYKKQFFKLLQIIYAQFFNKVKEVSEGFGSGPVSRFEIFLQNFTKNNVIPPPNGVLPPNFW